ncbi:MAG: polyphosphate kinase 1 [Oscillospiraceae bacterium]|nr:polyphosphate kinase 1 [Oscillospiraceae bacterium]
MKDNDLKGYFANRELSFLNFNRRVLEEAGEAEVPLLEKYKFIAIFHSNLDEFYMIRVGSLYEKSLLCDEALNDNKTGWSPERQLREIYGATGGIYEKADKMFWDTTALLEEKNIKYCKFENLGENEKKWLKSYFKREIMPLLSPQIIDSKHPFPHLFNKQTYVLLEITHNGKNSYGIISQNKNIERIIKIPGGPDENKPAYKYILSEDIIYRYAKELFKKHKIISKFIIRITRNADMTVENSFADYESSDVNIDYRAYMNETLKKRGKLAPVRIQISDAYKNRLNATKKYLCHKLNLSEAQVFVTGAPLDMNFIFSLGTKIEKANMQIPTHDMSYRPINPIFPKKIDGANSVTKTIEAGKDIFLHFPRHTMKAYLKLLEETVYDQNVMSVKITLYRLSENSQIINYLCRLAEMGKDVTVVVELQARFDEENNINWSKRLEEAGCNVIYGIDGYKIHSKITLITKKSGNDITYITHIGTGNYNENTARLYTDVGIITSDENIGADALKFFNSITTADPADDYKCLLVAPLRFKSEIIKFIRSEAENVAAGKGGHIKLKMNSLTDKEIMEELVKASQNGVKVDLLVRGICCLLPKIPGRTENIKVISVVGRFLEHSRIFIFKNNGTYISSADLMTRNTSRRLEIAAPIFDEKIKAELERVFDLYFADNVKAREICQNGAYKKVGDLSNGRTDAQDELFVNIKNNPVFD